MKSASYEYRKISARRERNSYSAKAECIASRDVCTTPKKGKVQEIYSSL